MADLRISELNTLAGSGLAAGDYLALADNSASETRKITVTDFVGNAVTLIADDTIPNAKILFNSASVPGSALENGTVDTTQIADGAVTATKLADFSSVTFVSSLPASGAFRGQIALDTVTLKIYSWNGSDWQAIKAAGSVNTIVGGSTGVVNVTSVQDGDTVTLNTTLDDTNAAAQFLAGPTNAAGAVQYRTIAGGDLPAASESVRGGVQVSGDGLRMDAGKIEINNDVIASGGTYNIVDVDSKGLVIDYRQITANDLPVATNSTPGAVMPGTDLDASATGVLNHEVKIAGGGTFTKVTVTDTGHISAGTNIEPADIPNLSADKITSGTIPTDRIANDAITADKIADNSITAIGGPGATDGVVTFPTAAFTGQYFYDSINGDLYLWDGNAWQAITITAGEIIYAGTFDASAAAGVGEVASVTTAGSAIGLTVGSALPAASDTNNRYYLIVSEGGTITSGNAPNVTLAPPDMILSNGTDWEEIDVSSTVAAQQANNITFTPTGTIQSTDVQAAIAELGTEKIGASGGSVTGDLLIDTTGTFAFEGSTANAYETELTVVDPTADRTITFPDASGTVITTGDTGTVTSTMLAGSIAFSKLATLNSGYLIVGNGSNQAAAVAVTGDIAISSAGVTSISAGAILNADINASAAIAFSKLAALDSGHLLIGDGSNVATKRSVTGDVTISNTGVTSIASGVIVNADISGSAAIDVSKLEYGTARQLLQTNAAADSAEWTSNLDIPGTLDVTGVGTFDAATRGAIDTLSDAATITPDFSAANHFTVTLAGNRTLANPTNLAAGQSGVIFITQDASGSRTLSYGSYWEFSSGSAPTLTTTAGAVDALVYVVRSSTSIFASLLTDLQ